MLMRLLLCTVVGATMVASPQLRGQTSTAQTVALFTWEDAALAGGFVVGTFALRPVDKYFATRLQNKYNQSNQFLQKTAVGFRTIAEPGAFIIGGTLYIAGRVSKQREMADLGLHGTEAVVIGGVFGGVLKNFFGRARPFVHPPTDSTGFD